MWLLLIGITVSYGLNLKSLPSNMKNVARNWFIDRAKQKGIDWDNLIEKNKKIIYTLDLRKELLENSSVSYPYYYNVPFHGYENGNLEWKAAIEGEAATQSISCTYWSDVDAITSEKWLRNNITKNIKEYTHYNNFTSIADFGCSVGVSTNYLMESFVPEKMVGIDLSPYFLSVAQHNSDSKGYIIDYIHANIENTYLPGNQYDLVTCMFVLHEVPHDIMNKILKEGFRLLKDGGTMCIIDMSPEKIEKHLGNNSFRKWAFKITEPYIDSYYKGNILQNMKKIGFTNLKRVENDPLNSMWLGQKSINLVLKISTLNKKVTFSNAVRSSI